METTYQYSGQEDLLRDTMDAPPAYAGFWLRFAAYIIDVIVMYVVIFVIALVFGMSSAFDAFANSDTVSALTIAIIMVVYLAILMYFPIMEASKLQATLGKRAVGIKVTDLYGNRIGFGRALGRFLGKFISSMIFGIGYIMAGFTEKKQGLHDMIASTLVVKG